MSRIFEKIVLLFRMNILIFVLLVFTVIAYFTYEKALDEIKFLNLSDYPYVIAESDSIDGGGSAVRLTRTDSSIVLEYELREGVDFPYAGVKILLGDGKTRGWDLSQYDSIFVWVKPRGEGSVRLYLRGYDNAIYRENDETSLKFNMLEFFPLNETYPAVFVPQEFHIPDWWVAQNEIDVHKARVDLSNIPLIEIQSGTRAALGYGTLEIRGLCFKGKVVKKGTLQNIVIVIWFVTFFVILVFRFFDYSRERAASRKKREELEKNLKALEIEKTEYERSSKEDPLTGCLNRAGFSSVLMREQENLAKTESPVSFVMLDIDHFKDVNDKYGHSVGDEVLVNLTKLIQSKIRNTDSLVRWGGEEFVILCSDTPIQNAQFLAEKLRMAIENTQLIKQQVVTCSFGIAEMVAGEDPKKLFERADKALYASKEGGRNRVTSATFRHSR